MKSKADYSLYLVTDRSLMSTQTLEEAVEQAIRGGCTMVQLREKTVDSLEFYEIAKKLKAVTDEYQVPLLINDRVDIALAVDATGVHVGQSDLPAGVVRQLIGRDKLLGVSVTNLEEALAAAAAGADYLGVGAMYATGTKDNARLVSMEQLTEITTKVKLPVVVIGGINRETIGNFAGRGIAGAAVVSGIISQPNITAATQELLSLFRG